MNAANHEDLHDVEIIRLMHEKFGRQCAAIMDGDKRATTDACNSLMEYLANSQDWPDLIQTALTTPGIIGKNFADLLAKVMMADAEIEAIREVECMEAEAKQNPDNCTPTRRQRIAMEWREAGA